MAYARNAWMAHAWERHAAHHSPDDWIYIHFDIYSKKQLTKDLKFSASFSILIPFYNFVFFFLKKWRIFCQALKKNFFFFSILALSIESFCYFNIWYTYILILNKPKSYKKCVIILKRKIKNNFFVKFINSADFFRLMEYATLKSM